MLSLREHGRFDLRLLLAIRCADTANGFQRTFGQPRTLVKTIRFLRDWWQTRSAPAIRSRARKVPPKQLETLESRVLLYAASGNAWPNKDLITISFMPDGTNLGGATSNLQSNFNTKFGSAAAWQNQVLKAAQYWAQQTNINFAVVSDNGVAAGSGSYQQGDPNFGDIRIGGFNFGNSNLAQAYLPPPINNYSIAGDIQINTGATFPDAAQSHAIVPQ